MLAAMRKAFHRFVQSWLVAFRHPPHHEMHIPHHLEPFSPALIEFAVNGAPDEGFEAFDVFPDGQVGDELRVVADFRLGVALAGLA